MEPEPMSILIKVCKIVLLQSK